MKLERWSFDVFDTCLVRRHANPSDVFLSVAYLLKDDLIPVFGADFAEVFREIRVSAEALALKRSSMEETTLEAIWYEVKLLIPKIDITKGLSIELDVERESLVVVGETLKLINTARTKFGSVIFISDSYLPRNFIEAQLKKNKCFKEGDICFLSSEYLKTKHTGNLYRFVISKLSISPENLTHHGDNLHSDVLIAQSLGIKAIHLPLAKLSKIECEIGRRLLSVDEIKSSNLIGAMRVARVEEVTNNGEAVRSLVAGFIGPFLWVLATWILQRAVKDGIKKLYFFSRDCHGLYQITNIISEKNNFNIQCKYLHVSRQSLLLPAVINISPNGIPWLRRSWEKSRLGDIASKLDLDIELIKTAITKITGNTVSDYFLKSEENWKIFWTALNTEPVRSILLIKINLRKESTLEYLRQEGIFEDARTGIVDLGWHQSCHAALADLVRMVNPKTDIPGYFLALMNERSAYASRNPAQAVFHRSPNDRRSSFSDSIIFSRIGLLEHLLNCAPHGTVHHYQFDKSNDKVIAHFLPTTESEITVKNILFDEVVKFSEKCTSSMTVSNQEARDILSNLLKYSSENPENNWAIFLSPISTADDQNNRDTSALTKPRQWKDFFIDFLHMREIAHLSIQEIGVWPELSLAASSDRIKLGYKFLRITNIFLRKIRIFTRRIIS